MNLERLTSRFAPYIFKQRTNKKNLSVVFSSSSFDNKLKITETLDGYRVCFNNIRENFSSSDETFEAVSLLLSADIY